MDPSPRFSSLQLVGRSLLPSSISGILCVCFSIFLIGAHLLLLSVSIGTSLPGILDGEWATVYTNSVVQPLTTLLNNLTFGSIMTAVLWGLAGLVVYMIFAFGLSMFKDYRESQKDIQFTGQRLLLHPTRKTFVVSALWRFGVLIIFVAVFVLVQPLIQHFLNSDPHLVAGDISLMESVRALAFALIGWTVLAHVFVVLLRLLLMRTRLFGDERIE